MTGHTTQKNFDFILNGFDFGSIGIECKNYREWLYPNSFSITETIRKALETDTFPLLVARRFHYTTRTNILQHVGIIAHKAYSQYCQENSPDVVDKVK